MKQDFFIFTEDVFEKANTHTHTLRMIGDLYEDPGKDMLG